MLEMQNDLQDNPVIEWGNEKMKIIVGIITLSLCLIACGKFESLYSNEEKTEMGNEIKHTEEKQMEENNRNIISEVLKFNTTLQLF